jgi:hypothetical protein
MDAPDDLRHGPQGARVGVNLRVTPYWSMRRLSQLLLLTGLALGALIQSGCYSETYSNYVSMQEVDFNGFKFELALAHTYSAYIPGHPAASGAGTLWIYTKSRTGRISAEDILLSTTRAENVHPLGILSGKRGSIEISGERVAINLELGIYDDDNVIRKYIRAPYNGIYELKHAP